MTEPDEAGPSTPGRPGTRVFTIEGRAAPALFVVGWLATLSGLGVLLVGALAPAGGMKSAFIIGGVVLLAIGLVVGAGSQGLERRARGNAFPAPSPFLLFAASVPVAVLTLVVIAAPLEFVGVSLEGPGGSLLSVTVQALIYAGLVRLVVVDRESIPWRDLGITRPGLGAFRELIVGATWALPVVALTAVVAAILVGALDVIPESPLPPTGDAVGFALSLVAAAIVAPIGEEIFFRAYATTAWVRTLGAGRAILRGGLFFAFVHIITIQAAEPGEGAALALVAFAARVPIGIVLCWLFIRRGSIWAPIGLHATFNAILLVIAEVEAAGGFETT